MFRYDIGIDLGTSSVIIYVPEKGIVLSEPSVVAYKTDTGKLIAAGKNALNMIGRNPESITVVRPLINGVISDFSATEQMLRYFIQKVCGNSIFKPRSVVCMPSTITGVEQRTIIDVVKAAGAGKACLIEEPLAAAIGAGLDISRPHGSMVIDVGGGSTDFAVITLGSMALSCSIRVAGNTMDEAIARYVKKKTNIFIGDRTAEEIKIKIGCAYPRDEELAMYAKGRNGLTGLPESFEITSSEVLEAIEDPLETIKDTVRNVLEKTPPELIGDISSDGIVMTGGGSLLYGINKLISEKTGIDVRVADDPINCVAIGAGMSLKHIEILTENDRTNEYNYAPSNQDDDQ